MKFIGIKELRTCSSKLWEQLGEEKEIVITSNGKPLAILCETSGDTIEDDLKLIKQLRAMKAMNDLQQNSMKKGNDKIKLNTINEEIQKQRKTYH